ncbi:MAG: biosynthetic arginine decarboxylase [Gammaproteobacteria bacterium]|nr:biosynthetic arginine decarboxylase [Gammaproteobacteria bacterium]MDH5651912.1 biosynthetic arginine decarboxylase [Gammaproteobacteria bacterium]
MTDWNLDRARAAYNLAHWSGGYFDINEQGHLAAYPGRDRSVTGIDLQELVRQFPERNLTLPVLVRFPNILHDRIDSLCNAFRRAMQVEDYQGRYTAVYPIKVNQQHTVVQEIIEYGGGCVGLEAGSKPELMAVLALADQNSGVIVCNGYKDREYIRLALIGRKLGHRIYIVLEKPSELELVIDEAKNLNVQPLLGARMRLASIGAGKWQNSGGDKSKFGLSAAQLLAAVERLRAVNMLDSLQMLHCHLGSQVANIRDIQRGFREYARYYTELHTMGVKINVMDVGGGLGVDYEGTRSRSFCSTNYSLQEYANNVVHVIWEACEENDLPHPDIFTESGRAMTAHHAMLITNVIETGQLPDPQSLAEPDADAPMILHDLWLSYQSLSQDNADRAIVEIYHDAHLALTEMHSMYTHGVMNLSQRAAAEELYYAINRKMLTLLQPGKRVHREILDELNERLADKYFCNLSIFQSIPDVWAIDQIFPIVPLHRHTEEPTRRGILEDITCDSDGRIDHYVDGEGLESSLPLHEVKDGETYLLGIFLVGAYQEILGDMHNLFGDTDSVNVLLNDAGGYQLIEPTQGNTVDDVLRYVNFRPEELLQSYHVKIGKADLTQGEKELFQQELEAGLHGYTYLED